MKTKHCCFLLLPVITLLPISVLAVTPKISIGYSHALLLKNDGSVWAWGYNGAGQLGLGNNTSTATPTLVSGLTGVVDVVAHGSFSMATKADGTVWVWGNNSDDLSGKPTLGGFYRNIPTQVTALHSIISVASSWGGDTAFAVDDNQQVWAWGNGSYGKLGNGRSGSNSGIPALIPNLANVVKVSATSTQAVALRSDGSSVGWGQYYANGDNLRLGLKADAYVTPSVMNVPQLSFLEAVETNSSGGLFMGINAQGSVLAWGDTARNVITCDQIHPGGITVPYYPAGLSQIQQISAGNGYALLLGGSSSVQGCGGNSWGTLGDGTTNSTSYFETKGPVATLGLPSQIAAIAGGDNASAALTPDGRIFTWGKTVSNWVGDNANKNLQATSMSINAGSYTNTPAVFAGTQTGALDHVAVDVGIAVASAHIGQIGELYFAAQLPNGALFLFNSTDWVPYDPAIGKVAPFYSGKLPANIPIPFGTDLDLTEVKGVTLILGYGIGANSALSNADLLNNVRYKAVVTLQ